jgi:hypothetical protein
MSSVREPLIASAITLATGMLQYPNELEVLKDLEPSVLGMNPQAVDTARRSMVLARHTQYAVASQFVTGAIPKTVDSLEGQLPTVVERLVETGLNKEQIANALADFVVAATMGVLLPVFEASSVEHPSTSLDRRFALDVIRGYVELIDDAERRWEEARRELARRDVEFSRFASDSHAGGFRQALQFALSGDRPVAYVDCRVIRNGEMGGMDYFEDVKVDGILRTTEGQFVTWSDGAFMGRHGTLETAVDEVVARVFDTSA